MALDSDQWRGIDSAHYMMQLKSLAVEAQVEHRKLIAAGYVWDGQDGYYLPANKESTESES